MEKEEWERWVAGVENKLRHTTGGKEDRAAQAGYRGHKGELGGQSDIPRGQKEERGQ